MHHIYHTEAYVLKTAPQNEAGMFVTLLTKDLGLVRATAQGIRYEKSKLRFAIQPYAKATVALVRGKGDIWRLTNAQAEENLYYKLVTPAKAGVHELVDSRLRGNDNRGVNKERFLVIVRVFKLLERLLTGEEADAQLFEIIDGGVEYLEKSAVNLLDFESVFVLRILNRLGYVGDTKQLNFYTVDNQWESAVIEKISSERKDILKSINEGIRQSQL